MNYPYLDPLSPILATQFTHLPHWHQGEKIVFVTFRLNDSIPAKRLLALEEYRQLWMGQNRPPYSREKEIEYRRLFYAPKEIWLDEGLGSCVLKDPVIADLVQNELLKNNGVTYQLIAYVIMPNHVHALLITSEKTSASSICGYWKGASSLNINRHLGRRGQLWQHETWDTILRSDRHLDHVRRYIYQNHQHGGILYDSLM